MIHVDNEDIIRDIEKHAENKGIPIIEKESIEFLKEYIKLNNIKNILEIGTATGYSAINMALVDEDVVITSIEKDNERYIQAIKNIKKLKLDNRIILVLQDALLFDTDDKYDLIFIDAAKSQYVKYFERFSKYLNDKGAIISDNIKFHGLVGADKSSMSRNVRGIISKLEIYINFLKNNRAFKTRFFDIGDGLAISKRKNKK